MLAMGTACDAVGGALVSACPPNDVGGQQRAPEAQWLMGDKEQNSRGQCPARPEA